MAIRVSDYISLNRGGSPGNGMSGTYYVDTVQALVDAISNALLPGAKLTDIGDVDAAAPNNGDVLTWDASSHRWVPASDNVIIQAFVRQDHTTLRLVDADGHNVDANLASLNPNFSASGMAATNVHDAIIEVKSASDAKVAGAANVGTGSDLYKGETAAHVLEFRRVRGDGSILVSVNGNDVVVGGAPASTTQVGSVELATGAETLAGSSATLAVTPLGLKAALDQRVPDHATAASPASDSSVGVIGNTGRYADEGHKHAVQLPAPDANNGIEQAPSDPRHFLHVDRLVDVVGHGTSSGGSTYAGVLTGTSHTGTDCTAFGHNALNGGGSGGGCSAFGRASLRSLSGTSYNMTALGAFAGYSSTNTSGCVFVGTRSGYYNLTGTAQTSVGTNSLRNNTTAPANTCVGHSALMNLQLGIGRNDAVGVNSLIALIDGANNSAQGRDSLGSLQHGDNNVGYGGHAGRYLNDQSELQTANSCVFIGYDTRALADNADNEIVIGFAARGHGSNTVTLGNGNITAAHIQVAWTVTSDKRDKRDIAPLRKGLDFLETLNPVEYYFKVSRENDSRHGRKRYGFIAQEVNDDVIVDSSDPEHLRITETALIPVLVQAVKELSARVAELEKEASDGH